MPRSQELTWDEGNKRWRKFYRGKPYTISCRQLRTAPTKSASMTAANQWWLNKKAEIDLCPNTLLAEKQTLLANQSALLQELFSLARRLGVVQAEREYLDIHPQIPV